MKLAKAVVRPVIRLLGYIDMPLSELCNKDYNRANPCFMTLCCTDQSNLG